MGDQYLLAYYDNQGTLPIAVFQTKQKGIRFRVSGYGVLPQSLIPSPRSQKGD
jgi:hypothetical protein